MGEEFDESVDTSSFDDVSSDFSDTDSFSEPMDVGDIMDDVPSEPIETYDLDSIDSNFEEDISSPETSDVADILDDSAVEIPSDETFSDVQDSSFVDSSDIPTETEDFEQDAAFDIADLMDEASIDDTTNDITESTEVSEVSEDNIESIMDDAEPLSDTIDESDNLNSSDMDDNVTEIDSLMDAEDPAQQDVIEDIADVSDDSSEDVSDVSTILDSNGIGDTVTDSETNDNPSETTDLSDVSIEETEDIVPDESQEIFEETSIDENTEDTDIDNSDISDDSQQITEDIGDVTEESEISEDSPLDSNASAYDQLAAYYSSHNYGQQDYAEYSQDPEWQELNNAYLQEIGQEPIDYGSDTTTGNSPIDSDASAYDQLAAYYSSHNYGQQDYAEYSQDPEWQELNNAYLQEIGQDPIDYGNDSITESQIETIETPSDNTEPNVTDTETVNDIQTDGSDTPADIASEPVETPSDIPVETPRVYDDFEQTVLEKRPDFYETGSFYEQGINEFGYQGTCGPTSQANALNELFNTNEFTENRVLNVAVDNNLCSMDSSPENCGGTTTEQFMDLYDKMNEQLDGQINTELYEYDNALDVEDVAAKLDEGCVLNVAVDASALWDQPRDYVNSMGIPCDDFYSDHWITVTGVQRDELGNVQGFDIIDSGGGVNYVDADKYHEMCFGTDDHKVIDPTAIVVSKNDKPEVSDISSHDTNPENDNNQGSWLQRIFGRRNK